MLFLRAALLIAAATLAGCGGGGSDSGSTGNRNGGGGSSTGFFDPDTSLGSVAFTARQGGSASPVSWSVMIDVPAWKDAAYFSTSQTGPMFRSDFRDTSYLTGRKTGAVDVEPAA